MSTMQLLVTLICFVTMALSSLSSVQGVTATNGEPFLPSTLYCNNNQDTLECANHSDRAWIFPPVRISLVCNHDFRRGPQLDDPNPYYFPNASSPTIQATWGDFVDYFLHLVPQLGGNDKDDDDDNVLQLIDSALSSGAMFWMHGGEGRPGWEIPPCGTNRTQGVAHFWHLAVKLNQTTTDPDLYNAGMTYAQALLYINEQSIRAGIEQYVCNDLERLDIGVDNGVVSYANHADFYPKPEEICPRVTDDDDDDTWKVWLIVGIVAVVVALAALAVGYYIIIVAGRRRRRQNNHDTANSSFPEQAVENATVDPSSKV